MSGSRWRFCRIDGLKWTTKILHRKSGKGIMVTAISHLLQSFRSTPLQKLWTVGRKTDLRYRRNGHLWTRVNFYKPNIPSVPDTFFNEKIVHLHITFSNSQQFWLFCSVLKLNFSTWKVSDSIEALIIHQTKVFWRGSAQLRFL